MVVQVGSASCQVLLDASHYKKGAYPLSKGCCAFCLVGPSGSIALF